MPLRNEVYGKVAEPLTTATVLNQAGRRKGVRDLSADKRVKNSPSHSFPQKELQNIHSLVWLH